MLHHHARERNERQMSELAAAQLTQIFTTPLMSHVWVDGPDLNPLLTERILQQERDAPGLDKTNVGGWHSETGQLAFCADAGRRLIRHIYGMADEATRRVLAEHRQPARTMRWKLQAWANFNRTGDFNRIHTHPGSTWSGTYYVDPGDPPADDAGGTPLHLFDPCEGRGLSFLPPLVPTHVLIRPEPGLMVLFPSYLPHMVYPHRGGRPRISIAFNLRREPFP